MPMPDRTGSRVLVRVRANSADFVNRPNWPFPAVFHSLLAIPRPGLAPLNWPEPAKAAGTPFANPRVTRGLIERLAVLANPCQGPGY